MTLEIGSAHIDTRRTHEDIRSQDDDLRAGPQREHSMVTELEPGRVFGWDSKGALGTVHHRFAVAAADGGTTLTKSAEFLDRSFLAKVTSWRISRGLPAGLQADVEKIKALLESPSS
jgi:hypothetical protein